MSEAPTPGYVSGQVLQKALDAQGDSLPHAEPWTGAETPYYDDQIKSVVLREAPGYLVSVVPQIFNDRVCLTTHDDYPHGWTAAWCYPKGGAAVVAALIWDPEQDPSPVGYLKVAGDAR